MLLTVRVVEAGMFGPDPLVADILMEAEMSKICTSVPRLVKGHRIDLS
jgi:hypothetical protein